jgi:hypothetical protein
MSLFLLGMAPGPFPALERLCGGSRPGKPVFGVDTLSPARKRFQFTEWYTLGQRTWLHCELHCPLTSPLEPPRIGNNSEEPFAARMCEEQRPARVSVISACRHRNCNTSPMISPLIRDPRSSTAPPEKFSGSLQGE